MKVKILAVVLLILVLAAGAFVLLNHMENYNEFFYTKVDNSRVKELNVRADEEMKFEYSLDCCDESGKKRELKFKPGAEGGRLPLPGGQVPGRAQLGGG